MIRPLTLTLGFCLAATTAAAGPDEIELTAADDIALAVAISDAVDLTAGRVMACIEDGGAHQDCLCDSAAEIAGVRDALDAALAVHPEWEGQALAMDDKGDGQSLTLFLGTVATSSAAPDCG